MRYNGCLPRESIHDNSARREVHEQTAAGGCECIDRFNKGTAIAANPLYRVRDRDNSYCVKKCRFLFLEYVLQEVSPTRCRVWARGTDTILESHLSTNWVYNEGQTSKWFKVESDLMFILDHSNSSKAMMLLS